MRDAVRGVAEHFPTAIVSGRCRDKVPFLPPSLSLSLFSLQFYIGLCWGVGPRNLCEMCFSVVAFQLFISAVLNADGSVLLWCDI
jgi:hypothetical protein